MTVGSLCSGIGGFDLGFERAGFEIRWQVEIDAYASAVLAQHWPKVRRYRDARTVTGLEPVDVICGGFPCQPHSLAGKRAGAADERDLWPHFARLIRECQPRWVVAENVPGLLSSDAGRFFGTVLGDLAACGYDAEWDCLPAAAFGAPHRRDRVWLVAYPQPHGGRCEIGGESQYGDERGALRREPDGLRTRRQGTGPSVADADRDDGHGRRGDVQMGRIWGTGETPHYDHVGGAQWRVEPNVGRVAHGVPARVDRLKGLGNAIVPQIAEWIAHRIREYDMTKDEPRRCPVCGCYQFVYKGDRAVCADCGRE